MMNISEMVRSCITSDPQLPRPNPTEAFWQSPPHPLSNIQSPTLLETVDVAIIGSGITACSVAKTLLSYQCLTNTNITVFEARTLTSGATGRNGGHLASPAAVEFAEAASVIGLENAIEFARFSIANVKKVQEAVAELDEKLREASELRTVNSVLAVEDEESWGGIKRSVAMFDEAMPEYKGDHRIIEMVEAREVYKFRNAVGAIEHEAGALWPYRLITSIFADLLIAHPSRFKIETNTPITAIKHHTEENITHPYELSTPRGRVKAARIIHCTNGHTSHLLPGLRGKLFPLRGTMSTQESGPTFPNLGASRSWSIRHKATLDPETGIFCPGLYYIAQNAYTSDIFIGGEKQLISQVLVSDDTVVGDIPGKNLRTMLPRLFSEGWEKAEEAKVKSIWSGIMGFTADGMPLIGRVTESVGGREGREEWIAAGFNGHGMDKCWLSGEAVARMIVGEDVGGFLPKAFILDDERLKRMRTEEFIELLMGM